MTAPHLSIVSGRDDRRPAPRRPPEFLTCKRTDEMVKVTNPNVGTLRVTMRGFYMFRDLLRTRDVLRVDEPRFVIERELIVSFIDGELAGRDRSGNRILVDRHDQIMYIVSHEDDEYQMLLAVYNANKSRT